MKIESATQRIHSHGKTGIIAMSDEGPPSTGFIDGP